MCLCWPMGNYACVPCMAGQKRIAMCKGRMIDAMCAFSGDDFIIVDNSRSI